MCATSYCIASRTASCSRSSRNRKTRIASVPQTTIVIKVATWAPMSRSITATAAAAISANQNSHWLTSRLRAGHALGSYESTPTFSIECYLR